MVVFGPAGAVGAHDAGVELGDQLADRQVELSQAEEALVAQARQHPALDQQHRLLDLALSRGLYGRAGTTLVP